MPVVELEILPPLNSEISAGKVTVEEDGLEVSKLLLYIRERVGNSFPVDDDGSPRPGYIILLDGVDVRILIGEGKKVSGDRIKLTVIPVNHGG